MRCLKLVGLGAVIGTIATVSILWTALYSFRESVSLSAFSRLRVGMTKEEVEEVLGPGSPVGLPFPIENNRFWISGDRRREIVAEFGEDGNLETAKFTVGLTPMGVGPPALDEESLIDRLMALWTWGHPK